MFWSFELDVPISSREHPLLIFLFPKKKKILIQIWTQFIIVQTNIIYGSV